MESVTKLISGIAISESHATPSTNTTNNSQPESSAPDIDKKKSSRRKFKQFQKLEEVRNQFLDWGGDQTSTIVGEDQMNVF